MPSYVEWRSSEALMRRMQQIQDAARPGSRAVAACRKDIRQIVVDDHADKMMRNVDRYGVERKGLADSTLLNVKRGSGPSLVPRGLLSRFVTHFEVTWATVGGYGQLVARFRDILSKKGKPFAQYHLTGDKSVNLPQRDVGGITPKGWYRVIQRHKQLGTDIIKSGG